MALAMDPPPNVIFFMTDGQTGNATATVEDISKMARATKTKINTIAMMQPQAEKNMRELAESTGGEFSIVNQDGTVTKGDDLKKKKK